MRNNLVKLAISKAFRKLRARGWVARANYWCCHTCARYGIREEYNSPEKWVYYHNQDAETFYLNDFEGHLTLAHSDIGVQELGDTLAGEGLNVYMGITGLAVNGLKY